MNIRKYFPILKSRENEFKALGEIDDTVKEQVIPIIEVIPETMPNSLTKLTELWNFDNNEVIVDFSYLLREDIDLNEIVDFLDELHSGNVNAVPVIEFNHVDEYLDLIGEFLKHHQTSLCIRVRGRFLRPSLLQGRIDNYLSTFNVNSNAVKLVFDLGYVDNNNSESLTDICITSITSLSNLESYEDIAIASGSFPENLSNIVANTRTVLKRYEWEIWQTILAEPFSEYISYGDYGIKNPVFNFAATAFEGSSSVKCTTEKDYVIYRGVKPSMHPKGGGQYNDHCRLIINDPVFDGASFSWGDSEINSCAARNDKPGNAGTWVKIGHSHHFAKILSLL